MAADICGCHQHSSGRLYDAFLEWSAEEADRGRKAGVLKLILVEPHMIKGVIS